MRILRALLAVTGLVLLGPGCTQEQRTAGPSIAYTVLDDQASQLRADLVYGPEATWVGTAPPTCRATSLGDHLSSG